MPTQPAALPQTGAAPGASTPAVQPYTPLTPQQYASAKAAGFTPAQIIKNEQVRKSSMAAPQPTSTGVDLSEAIGPSKPGETLGGDVTQIAQKITGAVGGTALANQLSTRIAAAAAPNQQQKDIINATAPSASDTAKSAASVALNLGSLALPYGTIERAGEAVAAPLIGNTLAKVGSSAATGALGGYGFDVAQNLQNGTPALQPGVNTAIGATLPLIGPAIGLGVRAAGETLGATTGVGFGPIKEAFEAASAGGARAKAFTDALRGTTPPEEIVQDARDALGQIVQDRSTAYQGQLEQVSKDNTKSFDISPVQSKFDSTLKDFNVGKTENGALDYSRSPGLGRYKQDISDIQNVLKDWGSKPGDRTVVGIDRLKQTLDDFRRGTADSTKFDKFVTTLRNSAQDIIRKEPGYSKLVGDYANSTGVIKEIQKGLSLGDKASVDTAFRKLSSALRSNNQFRAGLVSDLDKASGGFLSSQIAGHQLSQILPQGLIGRAEEIGGAGAILTGAWIPLLKFAAFASPRAVGEMLNAAGISKRVASELFDHLVPLGEKFQAPGDTFLQKGVPAVKDYLKAHPPSLGNAIKDINSMSPEERAALGNVPKALGGGPKPFEGFKDITTNLLDDLKGRATVSRQYVLDALNRQGVSAAEKDAFGAALDSVPGKTLDTKKFADAVKTELLPLTRDEFKASSGGGTRYERVNLPDDVRGDTTNYAEHIYNSPISTSAGGVHFNYGKNPTDNYFAHTRTEDVNDANGSIGTTRRVLEAQSDLFQKGRLENEGATDMSRRISTIEKILKETPLTEAQKAEALQKANQQLAERNTEIAKLKPYENTWQDRIIREEVKATAQDGKTTLQFPTGETAMKVEGLGENSDWRLQNAPRHDEPNSVGREDLPKLTPEMLKVGAKIEDSGMDDWVITDVLGDGKFKAVPKDSLRTERPYSSNEEAVSIEGEPHYYLGQNAETFDISGSVDKNNPIYKFYEGDVKKFLQKRYGAQHVTDPQGVTWYEVKVPKEAAEQPVKAFGKAKIGALVGGAAASAATVGALAAHPQPLQPQTK